MTTIQVTYRGIIDALSRGDAAALDKLVAPDIVDHNPIPNQTPGIDGFKQWLAAARTSFPDLRGTVNDIVTEGDRLAARVTWEGTHGGQFLGLDATGTSVSFEAFHLVRFVDGRAAEWWGTADLLGVVQQLGATVSRAQTTL
jgi:steroid delta-isomerase-like uncharacterized protein